jgi:hypothetical protein
MLCVFAGCGGAALATAFLVDLRKPAPGDFTASQSDKRATGQGQKPCGDEKTPSEGRQIMGMVFGDLVGIAGERGWRESFIKFI